MLQSKKQRRSRAAKKPSGFQCPFCGNYTRKADEYYSSLTTILAMRLIDFLKTIKEECCFNSVLDCIYEIFGPVNPTIRRELQKVGYLEKYDHRFGIQLVWRDQNLKEK